MNNPKYTKLSIREDKAASIASSGNNANLDAVGFNIIFIAMRQPKLAIEIMKLFSKASKIKENDPQAPDEEMALYAEELRKAAVEKLDN